MVHQAGILAFFRLLLLIIVVYYGFRLFLRFVLPYIFKYLLKKHYNGSHYAGNHQASKHFDGKESQKKAKGEKSKLGEYVDYEEVED